MRFDGSALPARLRSAHRAISRQKSVLARTRRAAAFDASFGRRSHAPIDATVTRLVQASAESVQLGRDFSGRALRDRHVAAERTRAGDDRALGGARARLARCDESAKLFLRLASRARASAVLGGQALIVGSGLEASAVVGGSPGVRRCSRGRRGRCGRGRSRHGRLCGRSARRGRCGRRRATLCWCRRAFRNRRRCARARAREQRGNHRQEPLPSAKLDAHRSPLCRGRPAEANSAADRRWRVADPTRGVGFVRARSCEWGKARSSSVRVSLRRWARGTRVSGADRPARCRPEIRRGARDERIARR